MQSNRISQLFLTLVVLLGLFLIARYFTYGNTVTIPLSEFKSRISTGEVAEVQLLQSSTEARGKFREQSEAAKQYKTVNFTSKYPSQDYASTLIGLMDRNNVKYDSVNPTLWDNLFSPSTLLLFAMFAVPIVFLIWLMNRQMAASGNNQAMNFGKSRARLAGDGKRRITFADVAGVDEAVEELTEVVDFLRDPKKYEALGAEIPKGVLLIGPPGCGKTHLAKAVAGEANVPFFYISGSDFVEMFVGVGASRVRDLFDQAKRRAPCLVFIDELDAVGRHRGTGIGGTHDEREQTLNQLLVEMDGFEPNSGIIVLSATNRPDVLDPALLRPGRFDRRIVVDAPDLSGRAAILQIYVRHKPMARDVNLEELAQRTPGFSGADIKNMLNEAAILAARSGRTRVSNDELYEAIDRVVAGPERKSRIISEHEKRVIAYHELGHAILSHQLLPTDMVHKVSILPRAQALGYTLQFPTEDRYLVSKHQILGRISVTLGGRAAEEMVFGDVYTGAQDDLRKATEMARAMVTKYGMSDELGPIQFGNQHENPFLGRSLVEDRNYSDQIAYRIDREVHHIINDCYKRGVEVLGRLRPKLDQIADVLIEKEHLNRAEFEELMRDTAPEGDGCAPAPVAVPTEAQPTPPLSAAPPDKPRIAPAPATG
jgi:cell division protease FtsH